METCVKHTLRRSLAGLLAITMASCCVPARPQIHADQTALALEQQGKTIEAEVAWKALSKAHPADAVPFAHLGLLEARQEHYPQAITYYRKAMALNPTMPGLRLNMGLALFKDGQYKQAAQTFAPILRAQPASTPEAQRLTILMVMSY
jgi:predicted Zn-dependent protease